jgi:hypothetical protein
MTTRAEDFRESVRRNSLQQSSKARFSPAGGGNLFPGASFLPRPTFAGAVLFRNAIGFMVALRLDQDDTAGRGSNPTVGSAADLGC